MERHSAFLLPYAAVAGSYEEDGLGSSKGFPQVSAGKRDLLVKTGFFNPCGQAVLSCDCVESWEVICFDSGVKCFLHLSPRLAVDEQEVLGSCTLWVAASVVPI